MPWSWSAPNANGPTMAQLEGHVQPRMPDLGPLVSALMQYRQRQAALQQKQMSDMISGIGSAIGGIVGGIGQQNQQGQANDAANAAIYGHFYPNDAASAYTDPGRVPDYGGTDALNAMRSAGEFNPRFQPQMPQLMTLPDGQQILYSPLTGGVHPLSAPTNADDATLKAAKAIVDNYTKSTGIPQDLLDSTTAVHSGVQSKGILGYGADVVPQGQYRVDLPETSKEDAHSITVNQADFDRAHKALDLMNQILNKRALGGVNPSLGASTYVPGMGGIEGGRLDATGHPAISYQLSPNGATFAVKPTDPRFGLPIKAVNPDGTQVTGTATDFGPGVKNVDLASSNPADAKSSPFSNATVTPSPQDAGKGLQPGTTRVVLGVPYVWNGDRWNPAK